MTTRNTKEEWLSVIEQAQKGIPSTFTEYKAPGLGTLGFAKSIDHTLLKLDTKSSQIDTLCEEARHHDFKSVCVRLKFVDRAVANLQGTAVDVACVVGFHEGTQPVSEKVKEAVDAVAAGASELDMVLNWVQLKAKDYEHVYADIAAIRNMAPHPVILKVILETSQLSREEIIAGCKLAQAARADFVKTSTGFNGPGASIDNVRLMKAVAGNGLKVKASGGVKTVNECVAMMEAGAERIGTSNGVWIMNEAQSIVDEITHMAGDTHRREQRPASTLTRTFSSS